MALFPVNCTPGPRVNGQPLPGMLLVTMAEEKGKPEGRLELTIKASTQKGHTGTPLLFHGLELFT